MKLKKYTNVKHETVEFCYAKFPEHFEVFKKVSGEFIKHKSKQKQ